MVWHDEERFLAEAKPLELHRGGGHGECLARPDDVREQRVAAVEHARDGIRLMRTQFDLWIHADESDMAAIIFARTGAVEAFVVERSELLAPIRVPPDPLRKRFLYELLLLLGEDVMRCMVASDKAFMVSSFVAKCSPPFGLLDKKAAEAA